MSESTLFKVALIGILLFLLVGICAPIAIAVWVRVLGACS